MSFRRFNTNLLKAIIIFVTIVLSGCTETKRRLQEVGTTPRLSMIENPITAPNYQPIIPMPHTATTPPSSPSLWREGATSFFRDYRANQIGDIVKIIINIDDNATFDNQTSSTVQHKKQLGINKILGVEGEIRNLIPGADPTNLLNLSSTNNFTAPKSEIKREEKINFTVPAIVVQVLPNGHLVLQGRQEIRLNNEIRQIIVAGIARPEDIDNNNMINSERLTETRISYGGEGDISEAQRPGYGAQIINALPF